MRLLLTGAAGMIGRNLAERIARDGAIGGRAVTALDLVDIVTPVTPEGAAFAVRTEAIDLATEGVAAQLIDARPDVIFHLAAIVSGEAESDFAKGYRINLASTQALLEAIRAVHDRDGYTPRVVFASSIAVFGAPFPEMIDDNFHQTPLTSYGTQKAMCELLLSDYSRRGILDGLALRLPTICIRPGKPNKAASGFFSNILREPLNGLPAVLPVAETTRHWFASPRAAVGFFLHAATLDGARVGPRRALNMPGLTATVADEIDALARAAGPAAVKLIERVPDATIAGIVANWPTAFDTARAKALGFTAETSFDEIIRVYLEDEMGKGGA
jgi:nucleoside-diphosphate-sugar epimerase